MIPLPENIRPQLNRCEITIYYLLTGMIQRQAKKSKRGAMYCYPSQVWLAKQLGYSRSWVNKCINHMDKIGLLLKTQRAKVKGRWRSCLYRFGENLWRALGRIREAIAVLAHRVNSPSHILVPLKNTNKSKDENLKFNPLTEQQISTNLTHVREIIEKLNS